MKTNKMNVLVVPMVLAMAVWVGSAGALTLFSDNFDSYSVGTDLVLATFFSGGWIYEQYEATAESLAQYNAGELTVAYFPTETERVGGGTMPVLARSEVTGDVFCNFMSGPLYCSRDGGKTWQYVSSPPGMLNEAFGVTSQGTLLLAGTWPFPGPDRMTTMRILRSIDGGQTWDSGRTLSFDGFVLPNGDMPVGEFFKPGVGYSGAPANLVSAYGRIIELTDGTVILPFYIEGNSLRPDTGQPYDTWALMARSRDAGVSWDNLSTIHKDFNESGLEAVWTETWEDNASGTVSFATVISLPLVPGVSNSLGTMYPVFGWSAMQAIGIRLPITADLVC